MALRCKAFKSQLKFTLSVGSSSRGGKMFSIPHSFIEQSKGKYYKKCGTANALFVIIHKNIKSSNWNYKFLNKHVYKIMKINYNWIVILYKKEAKK